MLPSDLLIHRLSGDTVVPIRLSLQGAPESSAASLITLFQESQGCSQGELGRKLAAREGDSPDYRVQRGLAHLLKNSFCTFEIVSPLDPPQLRERVFALSAQRVPGPKTTEHVLSAVAHQLSQEGQQEVAPQQVRQGLYADFPDNRLLTRFEAPSSLALIHRYNLSQVQGVFYRATQVTLNVHRNDPGEYKLLFRYLKLFQLMAIIEGDADHGFTITVDGPTSLFKPNTRYGLALAKVIPALLHVTRWQMQAELLLKRSFLAEQRLGSFSLDSSCSLVSHYPPGKPFDSLLEEAFAERWSRLKTDWRLEREVDLIPVPGSVIIPDFRLVHPDGRTVLLEIVGYWRPEYLRRKFAQVRRLQDTPFILAVSQRLNLEKAGVSLREVTVPVVWFKDRLDPHGVLEQVEACL